MRSERPKPLHVLAGKPMVVWVIDALEHCDVSAIAVVVGHGADRVEAKVAAQAGGLPVEFVEQVRQDGTGDATAVGLTGLPDDLDVAGQDVLVLTGDTPLLRPATIAALVRHHRDTDAACTVLTATLDDPTGYGRIVRGKDERVDAIVEHRDCTDEQLEITEINTGIFCFRRGLLAPALRRIEPANAQGELYLTDVVQVLSGAGHRVTAMTAGDPDETHGINDRIQLASAEAELRRRINERWMQEGVTMLDPERVYLEAGVVLDRDVTIYPDTFLRGSCTVGPGADLGPNTQLDDTNVGAGAIVRQTVATGADIGDDAVVGPWACLGPGDKVTSGGVTGPHYAGPNADV